MPELDDIIADVRANGEHSPYFKVMEQDAAEAAREALTALLHDHRESGDGSPLGPEHTDIAYQDFLAKAREARGLRAANRTAYVAQIAAPEGQKQTTGLPVLGRGVESGLWRLRGMMQALSPFSTEDDVLNTMGRANQLMSERSIAPGLVNKGLALTGSVLTEAAPTLALGGAGALATRAGAGALASSRVVTPVVAALAGAQSAIPEYYERRGQGFDKQKALEIAAAKGVSTGAITGVFGLTGLEAIARPALFRAGAKEYLKAFRAGALKEGGEEALDEAVSAYIDVVKAGDDVTFAEFAERMGWASVLGGGLGAGAEAARLASDPVQPPDQKLVSDTSQSVQKPVQPGKTVPSSVQPGKTVPSSVQKPARKLPDNDRIVWSRLANNELAPDQLDPARAARIAVDMTLALETETLPEPTRALLEKLYLRGGIPVDSRVRAPEPQPPAAPAPAAEVAEGVAQAKTPPVPAAPAAPEPSPVSPPVAQESKPNETSVPAQEGQSQVEGQSQGQEQGQVRPVREEVTPVVGEDATLEQRQENEIQARLKSGSFGASQVLNEASPDPRPVIEQLYEQIEQASKARDANITRRVEKETEGKPEDTARVIASRIKTEENNSFSEAVDRAKIKWMSQLSPEQRTRVRSVLKDTKNLTPAALAKLRSESGPRVPVTGTPGVAGKVVPAPKARPEEAPPGPVKTSIDTFDVPTGPARPEPVRESRDPQPLIDKGRELVEHASRPLAADPVVRDKDLPEAKRRAEAFGVTESPESPKYPAAIRERVIQTLKAQRQGLAKAQADALNVARPAALQAYHAAAKKAAGGKQLSNIDVNTPAFEPILAAMDAELQKHPAPAHPAPVRVRTGRGEFRDALLFESPSPLTALVEEYTGLYNKFAALRKREQTLEDTTAALADIERTIVKTGLTPEKIGLRDKLAAELKAQTKKVAASKNNATRTKKSAKDLQRLRDLSLSLRASMAEDAGKRIAAYITAKPGSERASVAKRFEDGIERGLVGMEQDLVEMIGGDTLVNPSVLRGALRPQYIARFTDTPAPEYSLVVALDRRRGTFMPFNQHGEPISRYSDKVLESAETSLEPEETNARVIRGLTEGDIRAGMDAAGNTTPLITKDLNRILEMSEGLNLATPIAELSRAKLDWWMQNGYGVDMKGREHEIGQAPIKALPLDGHPGLQTETDLARQEKETAEDYLRRVLITPEGGRYTTRNGKKIEVYKTASVDAVHAALDGVDNGRLMLKWMVDNRVVIRKGNVYQTGDGPRFRFWGVGPLVQPVTPGTVLSAQQMIEHAAKLFDLTVFVGGREGVDLPKGATGLHAESTRTIALAQYDVATFLHEFGHDLTVPHLGMVADPAVLTELAAVTRARKIVPASASEGAAELTALWVEDSAQAKRDYPAATGWLESVFALTGVRERMDALAALDATRRTAPAGAVIQATQRSLTQHGTDRKARGTSNVGTVSVPLVGGLKVKLPFGRGLVRGWSESMDNASILKVVDERLKTGDFMDLVYEAQMAGTGHTSEAVDGWLNGHRIDAATEQRAYGFNQFAADMRTMGLSDAQQVESLQYIWGKSVLERDPLLRRKLFREAGLNENAYGPWATTVPVGVPNQPGFDSVAELEAYDAMVLDQWEKVGKAAGLPKPKPLAPGSNPVPGSGADSKDSNVTRDEAQLAFNIIKPFKNHPYESVADLWRDLVRGFDDWRLAQGLITESDHAQHREVLYYVPKRTERTSGLRVETKGSGGADLINPIQAMMSKVQVAYYWRSHDEPVRAVTRAGLRVIAERRDNKDPAAKYAQTDVMLNEWIDLASITLVEGKEAVDAAAIRENDQQSPLEEEFFRPTIDERTLEAMLAADVVPAKFLKDPRKLIGRTYSLRVKDPMVRAALRSDNDHVQALFGNHWAWQIATAPTKVTRQLLTLFSATFQAKNAVRDTFTAFMQSVGLNPAKFTTSTWAGLQDAFTYARDLSSNKTANDKLYSALAGSGVMRSGLLADAQNVEAILSQYELGKAMSQLGGYQPQFSWLRKIRRPFDVMSNTIDGANRMGEYRRVISLELSKLGVSSLDQLHKRDAEMILRKAKRAAQEVTVNFARRGGKADQFLNELVPFFNPAKQGTLKTFRTLTAQRIYGGDSQSAANVRAAVAWGSLVTLALAQHLLLGDDPEALEDYQEKSDQERVTNLMFPVGKYASGETQFMKVPKPQGPYAGVLYALEKLFGMNPAEWSEIARETFSQSTPQSVMPTSLQLALEVTTGRRVGGISAGRTGVPEWMKDMDPKAQTSPNVSASSHALSDVFQTLGLPIGPLAAENLITGYTGGLGSLVVDAPKWWDRASGQDKVASFDAVGSLPVMRAFMSKSRTFASRSITRARDLLNEVEGKADSADSYIRQAENNSISPSEAAERITSDPTLMFGLGARQAARDFRQSLSDGQTYWNRLNADTSLTVAERRVKMDAFLELMTAASKTFYDAVNSARQKVEKNNR